MAQIGMRNDHKLRELAERFRQPQKSANKSVEMGRWNGHKFVVSRKLIRGFNDLSFTGGSNTDMTLSDEQEFVTRTSGKPMEVTLTVELYTATGCNVRKEALALVEQARAGAKNYFYVGKKKGFLEREQVYHF